MNRKDQDAASVLVRALINESGWGKDDRIVLLPPDGNGDYTAFKQHKGGVVIALLEGADAGADESVLKSVWVCGSDLRVLSELIERALS